MPEHAHAEPNGNEQAIEFRPIVRLARPAPAGRHMADVARHAARMSASQIGR